VQPGSAFSGVKWALLVPPLTVPHPHERDVTLPDPDVPSAARSMDNSAAPASVTVSAATALYNPP
jgi:hypothetical protein